MLMLALGCAMNLAEMRSARVLEGGEWQLTQVNSVVVPSAAVARSIDPARELLGELGEDDELSAQEREVVLGGLTAVALSSPGYGTYLDAAVGLGHGFDLSARVGNGSYSVQARRSLLPPRKHPWHLSAGLRVGYSSGGAWLGVLDLANTALSVSSLRRLDLSAHAAAGRDFGEWGKLWWGPRLQASPYRMQLDASRIGLDPQTSTGTLGWAGGFVGGGIGWRWVHFCGELTVLGAWGRTQAYGSEYSVSGVVLAPHWGVQVTL